MTRDDILAVVTKHLSSSVDGVDAHSIDPVKSMKDYGANSLDMVEVVSACMRELKIKVPRAELTNITNIDGLVDLLHSAHQQSQAAKV